MQVLMLVLTLVLMLLVLVPMLYRTLPPIAEALSTPQRTCP